MPNPTRQLLRIYEINITYLTDIILVHIQRLGVEERAADSATATTYSSVTIAISPASMPTLPDVPFWDTS